MSHSESLRSSPDRSPILEDCPELAKMIPIQARIASERFSVHGSDRRQGAAGRSSRLASSASAGLEKADRGWFYLVTLGASRIGGAVFGET